MKDQERVIEAVVEFAVSSLPRWCRWMPWIRKRHARWARMAANVWLNGTCLSDPSDEKFLNKLHMGEWKAFPWATIIHERFVEEELIDSGKRLLQEQAGA